MVICIHCCHKCMLMVRVYIYWIHVFDVSFFSLSFLLRGMCDQLDQIYYLLNSRRYFKHNTTVHAIAWMYAYIVVGVDNDDFRISAGYSFKSYLAAVAIAIPISIQSYVHEMSMIQMSRCELIFSCTNICHQFANVANKNFSIFSHLSALFLYYYYYYFAVFSFFAYCSSFILCHPTSQCPVSANTFATLTNTHL